MSTASIEQCDGKLPVKWLVSTLTPCTMPRMPSWTMHQSWPGTRRRRDSQPSIHLPRDVYLPGMNTAGSGLTRFAFGAKKSSLVATARPPTRADARSARLVNSGAVAIEPLFASLLSSYAALSQTSYGKSRIRLVQVSRRGDRHDLRDLTVAVAFRGRLRHIVYGGRQSRRAADRHDEEYRVCAGGPRRVREPESFGIAARPAFPRPQSAAARVHVDIARARLGPHRRRRPRARPGVRAPRPRNADGAGRHRSRARRRQFRHRRPRHHEVVALGVCRLPAR